MDRRVYGMFKFNLENMSKKLVFGSITDYDVEKEILLVATRQGDMNFHCIPQKIQKISRNMPVVIFAVYEDSKKALPEVINMYNDEADPKKIDAIQVVISKLEAY